MYAIGLVLFFSIALAGAVSGGLTFDQKIIETTTKPGEQSFPFEFAYRNDGDALIRITDVKSSCGCTTTALQSALVEPGSAGTLSGVFHLGDRQGLQEKTIVVRTDASDDPGTVLRLKITIPRMLTVRPGFVFWSRNGALEEQMLQITLNPDLGGKLISISSENPLFAIREEVDEETGATLVYIRPENLSAKTRSRVQVVVGFPDESEETYFAHLMVR